MLSKSEMTEIDEFIDAIDEFSKIRSELLKLKKRKAITEIALKTLIKKTNCKTASIFLISKKGLLERFGIEGTDADNNAISNNNFSNEVYEIGQNITGKAAISQGNSGQGKNQYAFNPIKEEIIKFGKLEYLEKLKEIKCIISIPLNGQSKTYGVLEVIYNSAVSKEDLTWLSAIQSDVATALSNSRRDEQTKIFTNLGKLLVNFDDTILNLDDEVSKLYKEAIKGLLIPETSFQVCILRIKDDKTDDLIVKAIESCDPSLLEGRQNDNRKFGTGFVWEAVKTGKPIIIENINSRLNDFINKEWIEKQNFKSFGCFPLVAKKEVLGSLSIFIGYRYNFHDNCKAFLTTFTSQIALFEENLRQTKRVRSWSGEEAFLQKKREQLELNKILDNYEKAKKTLEQRLIRAVEQRDDQIKQQNSQIIHLRELVENLQS